MVWDYSSSKYAVFMPLQIMSTPPECIANKNRNKVRVFTKFTAKLEQMSWQKVKIVCKNTFSKKGTPFGLASVRFNVPSTDQTNAKADSSPVKPVPSELPIKVPKTASAAPPPPPTPPNGKGTEEKEEEEKEPPAKKLLLETPKLSSEAKDVLKKGPPVISHPLPPPPPPALPKPKPKPQPQPTQEPPPPSPPPKKSLEKSDNNTSEKALDDDDDDHKPTPSKEKKEEKEPIMFMKGVTLSISGIGNPERSEIRNIVISHGGKYTNDM